MQLVWGLFALFLCGIVASLWLRVCRFRNSYNGPDVKQTPLSMAVQELIATAGGVYLAMIALTSFVKLETPDQVTLMQVSVDPLAALAILLAIVQPAILLVYQKIKIGR